MGLSLCSYVPGGWLFRQTTGGSLPYATAEKVREGLAGREAFSFCRKSARNQRVFLIPYFPYRMRSFSGSH